MLHHQDELLHWHQFDRLGELRLLLHQLNQPQIELIPQIWNKIAIALAGQGIQSTQLSLYHKGLEKPK